ncbi:MAG: bifunctional 23S rRNA (guanine(2069)-N(7))-methyltransferase RlmK/23S rRNA (guanine(2445)-N(2))-methyltransferase RlmL, partial [Myxococcales bacterium]|nr:bifunctional 23S rRNA (guanine(2069)-N(7))-methyltransferase RlmK/23S rRNA (guanine(2445)-N(2))-methyltransferase RlmL [Myxococcales bacterium]
LAAALLRMTGWNPTADDAPPLVDPMCGSGTLLIEGALWATDTAPGLLRDGHGFRGPVGWEQHEASTWKDLLDEARDRSRDGMGRALDRGIRLHGADRLEASIRATRQNARAAGIESLLRVSQRELQDSEAPSGRTGVLITNPPYGERLGEAGELGPLYEMLGDTLKHRFPGWDAWIFSATPTLLKRVGLKRAATFPVHNGPLEGKLVHFPIRAREAGSEEATGQGNDGPGWRRPSPEAEMFQNRVGKNLKRLRKWAKASGNHAYRLYDAEIPEYNVSVDWYDGHVRVTENHRPRHIPEDVAERRLRDVLWSLPEILQIDRDKVSLRVRARRSAGDQHEKRDSLGKAHIVREGDLRFEVNLEDYFDTGLFLDDRELRGWIRKNAKGARFLNLFCYTCTASVAAAKGGASAISNVDLSQVYLDWGARNFALNDIPVDDRKRGEGTCRTRFVRADGPSWIFDDRSTYDLAFVAPPTYSKSKGTVRDFDIRRDHRPLLRAVAARLAPGGQILFTTNAREFELELTPQDRLDATDITDRTVPQDFARSRPHRAFLIRPR